MSKKDIINTVITIEGGYVHDPSDSGGETNHGITKQTALSYGYKGDMKNLSIDKAFNIYDDLFWKKHKCDDLIEFSEKLAHKVFDMSVNIKFGESGKILQRTLNVLNNEEKLYSNIEMDGIIGSKSIETVKICLKLRDEEIILKMMNGLHCVYYIELAEKRTKDQKFVYGWVKNRIYA